jgi:glycine betaine catabolism B
MLNELGSSLTRITMYRLMLYYLGGLVAAGVVLSSLSWLPVNPVEILANGAYLVLACYASNQFFARVVGAKPNVESQFISALILTLILGSSPVPDGLPLLTLAAVGAMGSKYLIAWKKRHILNPAAFGALLVALVLSRPNGWWAGDITMIPFVVLGGLIVAQRTSRFPLVGSFLAGLALSSGLLSVASRAGVHGILPSPLWTYLYLPIGFFAFIMLVEPLTGPQDPRLRVYFGLVVGALYVIYRAVLPAIPFPLELALLTGNVLARIVRFDPRMSLILRVKEPKGPDTMSFWFEPPRKLAFTAGQFCMLTVPHVRPDSRGVRRFFSIASSPTEDFLLFATRFQDNVSSFKSALRELNVGDEVMSVHLEGRFTLPSDPGQSLVFIAGGIGITPFRSIIKYMTDAGIRRPVTLFYANRQANEILFRDVFDQAEKATGLKTVYTLSGDRVPEDWTGKVGRIDGNMIRQEVPDYPDRTYYVSGPEPMVIAFEKMLSEMGIPRGRIKKDSFQGYSDAA